MKNRIINISFVISILFVSVLAPYTSRAENEIKSSEIFLAADDPKNPLTPFRIPITYEIVNTADEILKGKDGLTPHQKIIAFMDHIAGFNIGVASDSSPETTINERVGACGTFTNLLLALAATQGIPGRVISLGNFPKDDGHAVAELWINGKWRLYDPTYASYYTDTPGETKSPNVLSFEELRKGEGRRKGVVLILRGKEHFNRSPEQAKYYVEPDIYEKADPAGPIGPEHPFVYQLQLDIDDKPAVQKEHFGPKNQGASYIGAAGINNFHKWTLTSLNKDKTYELEIVPDWIGGDITPQDSDFTAMASVASGADLFDNRYHTFSTDNLKSWKIRFIAKSDVATFLISHPYRGPKFRYVVLKEIKIKEVIE